MLFDRTFHPDEANQAFTVGRLLETGSYTYRPTDHHGPTLYYSAAPLQKMFGHTTTADLNGTLLRCTPLLFAVLTLVCLAQAIHGIVSLLRTDSRDGGRLLPILAAGATVLLLGTSPLFVFYATDFIQETLLACFTAMALWSAVGYARARKDSAKPPRLKPGSWALLFGSAAGLCFATKETCVLTFAAAALTAVPVLAMHMRQNGFAALARIVRPNDLVLAFLAFGITSVVLFSSFCQDWSGVYNAFVAAPLSYLHRAAGEAAAGGANWHVHPVTQYVRWFFLGEPSALPADAPVDHAFAHLHPLLHWTALLLALGARAAWLRHRGARTPLLIRAFLGSSLYFALLFGLYSAIPYKTPWCAVQILAGLLLAAVLGYALLADVLVDVLRARGARASRVKLAVFLSLVFLPGCVVLRAHLPGLRKICAEPDSAAIPYNYAHASPEAQELASCVDAAMRAAPGEPFVAVVLPPEDTWPFPWYNRPWESRTGYWTTMDELVALAEHGSKPTVVVVPMRDGHLVQPLFPHLRHTKRFYMRPKIPERGVVGTRVRVFW